MKNKWITIFAGALVFASLTQPVCAQEKEAGATASLSAQATEASKAADMRITKLEKYLESVGSPMADDAKYFIAEADRLNLDWRLVVAISGNESYFGRHIPAHSYNGWGWAVWTGRSYGAAFADWKEGITTVSEGLKYNYINRGAVTVEQIGAIYAADRNWAYKVNHFIWEIEAFTPAVTEQLELI